MATAHISFHPVAMRDPYQNGSSLMAPAVYSEILDFTSAQDTSAALTSALAVLSTIKGCTNFAVMITADADCYIAIGSTPDCTVTTATSASGARTKVTAGIPFDCYIDVGAKIAAKAV
jgi:hypothetical protein